VASTRVAGRIALIGVLTGGAMDPVMLMRKSIRLQGIYVGSRAMFERMNRAIAQARLEPVIDRRFGFEEARDAYRTMRAAGHFGKLVIDIGSGGRTLHSSRWPGRGCRANGNPRPTAEARDGTAAMAPDRCRARLPSRFPALVPRGRVAEVSVGSGDE